MAASTAVMTWMRSTSKAERKDSISSPKERALAFATNMSTPPNSVAALSTQLRSAPASLTSTDRPQEALAPLDASALTASSTASLLRAQIATAAPSDARRSAIARPMPLVDPVTSAFFPASCRSISCAPKTRAIRDGLPRFGLQRVLVQPSAYVGLWPKAAVPGRPPHVGYRGQLGHSSMLDDE